MFGQKWTVVVSSPNCHMSTECRLPPTNQLILGLLLQIKPAVQRTTSICPHSRLCRAATFTKIRSLFPARTVKRLWETLHITPIKFRSGRANASSTHLLKVPTCYLLLHLAHCTKSNDKNLAVVAHRHLSQSHFSTYGNPHHCQATPFLFAYCNPFITMAANAQPTAACLSVIFMFE